MRNPLSLIAIIAVLSLVGCAPEAEPVPQPTEPLPTLTATPTPTPTVEPVVKPALNTLVISPDGLGPIRIGQAYTPKDPALDVLSWDDTFCGFAEDPAYDPGYASYDYGNWKNTYGDEGTRQFLAEVTYDGGTVESPIIRITTFSGEIRTEGGLGIGSTVDQVVAEYGDDLITSPEDSYYPYVVPGRSGQLVFWFSYETPGVVYMLQVLPSAETPEWSFHSTGCV